jgi:nucleotide-binding universal stress UspA family protein
MLTVRTVLYPTDFSDPSRPAFELACSIAREYAADLLVLHVLTPSVVAAPNGMVVTGPSDETEWAGAQMDHLRPADPFVSVGHRLVEGDPAHEILRVAETLPADLIVMGTHGRTGLSRVLMGSVAESVMRKARCPVLTVRNPSPGEKPAPPKPLVTV